MLTSSMAGLLALSPTMTGGVNTGLYTVMKHAMVGYSEMLRHELEPESIGVSVLCPGLVESNLGSTSAKHRPERFGGPMEDPQAGGSRMPPGAMPNEAVGPIVVRGITANRAYIITHPETEPMVTRASRAGHRRLRVLRAARVSFAAATAVTPVRDGEYAAEIADGWDIMGNANGGYLLAIAARAVTEATGRPDPVTITAHYLAPGQPGPARVSVDIVRAGGRHTTSAFRLDAGERTLLVGVATTTELRPDVGPTLIDAVPPDLPPPEDCVEMIPGDPLPPPFFGRVRAFLHPDDARFREAPSGEARMRGWFGLRDGEPLDTLALVMAVDALPPTSFNASLPVGWTPTVELTAHVRRHPVDGLLACAFVTRHVAGGYLESDGEIWDASGALVAQSRQLQLVPSR